MLTPNQCDAARCCPIGSSYVFTDTLEACRSIQRELTKRNTQLTSTNSTTPTTQDSRISTKVPRSYDEFLQQAQTFEKNARAEGVDPLGIAEGIKFMYKMTQEQIKLDQKASSTNPLPDPCVNEMQTYSVCLSEYNAKMAEYNSCLAGDNKGMMCFQPTNNCYRPAGCG